MIAIDLIMTTFLFVMTLMMHRLAKCELTIKTLMIEMYMKLTHSQSYLYS